MHINTDSNAKVTIPLQLLTNYNSDDDVIYLLANYDFIFVPVLNPDGYEYTWTDVSRKITKISNYKPSEEFSERIQFLLFEIISRK